MYMYIYMYILHVHTYIYIYSTYIVISKHTVIWYHVMFPCSIENMYAGISHGMFCFAIPSNWPEMRFRMAGFDTFRKYREIDPRWRKGWNKKKYVLKSNDQLFFSCWLLPIYLALWWRYLIASAGYPKLWNQFPNIIHTISFHFVLYWAYNMNFRKSTRYLSTWAIKKTTLSHLSILVG